MKEKIQQLAQDNLPLMIEWRRHLHTNPELSFQELKTADYIAFLLDKWQVAYTRNVGGHGIVALIKGKNPRKSCIALRADMDALPITETNNVPYKSKQEGVMHACGHDAHTASLLGTVLILQNLRDTFEGTVKCLFQPAEEKLPGGASLMIKAGALEQPKPAAIFGQHVQPNLEAGTIGIKSGIFMASADEIYMTVKGRGGHGAMPNLCIDPVLISAQILMALQQVISRFGDPAIPTVLSFGKINSVGGATNVIPNSVTIEGTFRTMHEKWRSEAHKRIRKIADLTAKSFGGACDIQIIKGYPMLHNHEELTAMVKQEAIFYLGKSNVVDLPIRMTSEDFAFFAQTLPACFYRWGTGNASKGINAPVHTSNFDIDESSLETGSGLMAWLAIAKLANPKRGSSNKKAGIK